MYTWEANSTENIKPHASMKFTNHLQGIKTCGSTIVSTNTDYITDMLEQTTLKFQEKLNNLEHLGECNPQEAIEVNYPIHPPHSENSTAGNY